MSSRRAQEATNVSVASTLGASYYPLAPTKPSEAEGWDTLSSNTSDQVALQMLGSRLADLARKSRNGQDPLALAKPSVAESWETLTPESYFVAKGPMANAKAKMSVSESWDTLSSQTSDQVALQTLGRHLADLARKRRSGLEC